MHRRAITAAIIALATLPLAACNNDSNATPAPFTPSTTSTSPTSPPPNGSEQAGPAAVAAYRRYIEVIDAMTASGGTDVKDLPLVTAGIELGASQNQAATYRGRKLKTIGSTKIIWAKATMLGAPTAGTITSATVQACYDTSTTQAVDSTGKSVKRPGTPTRWLDNREVRLIAGAWKVVNGKNQGAQC
ncbi:hypothetical protein AB0L70_34015 [Kribbella sp. NPDC051952]|uniref:hypothetical protein n=1 Tax=Kribbella sp. NPDC051952 TaxID=3154851 RepID=UPI00341D8444